LINRESAFNKSKLADWIEQTAARIGGSQGKLIRDHLERARQSDNGARKFMHFGGVVRGGAQFVDAQGILEKVRGIADTGLLVALVNPRDAHHTWALHVGEQVAEPLLTCEPVLAETAFHLGNVEFDSGDGVRRIRCARF
jgi:hypothetical protein